MAELLNIFEEIKCEILRKTHPVAEEDISFRYAYATGISITLHHDGVISEKRSKGLYKLLRNLQLDEEELNSIVKSGERIEKETVKDVISTISDPNHQILYLLDLYLLASEEEYGEIDEKIEKAYIEMFQMRKEDEQMLYSIKSSISNGDYKNIKNVFTKYYKKNLERTYSTMVYFTTDICKEQEHLWQKEVKRLRTAKAEKEKDFGVMPNSAKYYHRKINDILPDLEELTRALEKLYFKA